MKFVVKRESLPIRCEICHQADLFDPFSFNCSRCQTLFCLKPTVQAPTQYSNAIQLWMVNNREILLFLSAFLFGFIAPRPWCGNCPYHILWVIVTVTVAALSRRWTISLGTFSMAWINICVWIKIYYHSVYYYFGGNDPFGQEFPLLSVWEKFLTYEAGLPYLIECFEGGLTISLSVFLIKILSHYFCQSERKLVK